jgi:hypothetical protein
LVVELLHFRVQEALDQQVRYPAQALTNPYDRAAFMVGRSLFGKTATGAFGLSLEAGLFGLGALVLLRQTWRKWPQPSPPPAEGLVVLTVLVYCVGLTGSLLVAWERYLVPTLLLGTLLSGVGAAWIVRWLPTASCALSTGVPVRCYRTDACRAVVGRAGRHLWR